jgi:hypothetical protein
MKTPAVFDFGALRGEQLPANVVGDPVLDLGRQLDEAIAAQEAGTEEIRRIEAEYPHDAAFAAESAAIDLDTATEKIGEEAAAAIFAVYCEQTRRDRIRWDIEEKLMQMRAKTLAGARIQLAWVLAQLKEGMDVGPEDLEPVMESLNAIEEAQS